MKDISPYIESIPVLEESLEELIKFIAYPLGPAKTAQAINNTLNFMIPEGGGRVEFINRDMIQGLRKGKRKRLHRFRANLKKHFPSAPLGGPEKELSKLTNHILDPHKQTILDMSIELKTFLKLYLATGTAFEEAPLIDSIVATGATLHVWDTQFSFPGGTKYTIYSDRPEHNGVIVDILSSKNPLGEWLTYWNNVLISKGHTDSLAECRWPPGPDGKKYKPNEADYEWLSQIKNGKKSVGTTGLMRLVHHICDLLVTIAAEAEAGVPVDINLAYAEASSDTIKEQLLASTTFALAMQVELLKKDIEAFSQMSNYFNESLNKFVDYAQIAKQSYLDLFTEGGRANTEAQGKPQHYLKKESLGLEF